MASCGQCGSFSIDSRGRCNFCGSTSLTEESSRGSLGYRRNFPTPGRGLPPVVVCSRCKSRSWHYLTLYSQWQCTANWCGNPAGPEERKSSFFGPEKCTTCGETNYWIYYRQRKAWNCKCGSIVREEDLPTARKGSNLQGVISYSKKAVRSPKELLDSLEEKKFPKTPAEWRESRGYTGELQNLSSSTSSKKEVERVPIERSQNLKSVVKPSLAPGSSLEEVRKFEMRYKSKKGSRLKKLLILILLVAISYLSFEGYLYWDSTGEIPRINSIVDRLEERYFVIGNWFSGEEGSINTSSTSIDVRKAENLAKSFTERMIRGDSSIASSVVSSSRERLSSEILAVQRDLKVLKPYGFKVDISDLNYEATCTVLQCTITVSGYTIITTELPVPSLFGSMPLSYSETISGQLSLVKENNNLLFEDW